MTSYDQDFGQPTPAKAAEHALRQAAKAQVGAPLVSRAVEALKAYPPGRPWRELAKEIGIAEEDILLLAANENVLGPSPRALSAIAAVSPELHLYPDGGARELRAKLAERLDVDPSCVAVGNGSNEIIELLIRTFVGPEETVVTAWPSFVVYRLASQAHSRDVLVAPLAEHRYDLNAMAGIVDHRTKLVFIANPNNPTGTYVTEQEIELFLGRIPPSTIVVLDEAYFEYTTADDFPNGVELFRRHPRLVVLRTFSKAYGLAGLRVGYGVMSSDLVDYLDRVRQPYNVNALAQAAARAALDDHEHVDQSRAMVEAGKAQLEVGAERLGLRMIPSQTNFVVIELPFEGAPVQQALRQRGILVRAMEGYGMPNSIRLTVGTEAMNIRVLEELSSLLPPARNGR